ncbi:MAG TPA: hypothetical protein VFS43_41375 [Polyangiaceae bacterium]|nr:hypothetical protein [Polyangiaceae bacterium]
MANERTRAPHPKAPPRLGVDIGRVIIAPVDPVSGADTEFLGGDERRSMLTPPAEGAFAALRELNARFGGGVWIVSKAGPRVQALTRRWLERWRFFALTGVRPANLYFCRERHEKAEYARRFGLTHFVDDRQDVLAPMRGLVPNLLLFGAQRGPAPPYVRHVRDWKEALAALADVGPASGGEALADVGRPPGGEPLAEGAGGAT